MTKKPMLWRNRIIGYGEEAPDQLLANPKNWRIHPKAQQEALSGVLEEVGWVQAVIVNKRSGFVLDGHLRAALAISHGDPVIPVIYVDLSPEEEAEVMATLDPLGAMAAADGEKLAALLEDVKSSEAAVQQMLAEMALETNQVMDLFSEATPAGEIAIGRDGIQRFRPLLVVEEIELLERALHATGQINRAEALMEICREYLDRHAQRQ